MNRNKYNNWNMRRWMLWSCLVCGYYHTHNNHEVYFVDGFTIASVSGKKQQQSSCPPFCEDDTHTNNNHSNNNHKRRRGRTNHRISLVATLLSASSSSNHHHHRHHGTAHLDSSNGSNNSMDLMNNNFAHRYQQEEAKQQQQQQESSNTIQKRRQFLHTLITSTTAAAIVTSNTPTAEAANYYPLEMESDVREEGITMNPKLSSSKSTANRKAAVNIDINNNNKNNAKNNIAKVIQPLSKKDVLPTFLWATALWLWTGSRSNPIVSPLAQTLYSSSQQENNDEEQQQSSSSAPQWVQDRKDGYFTTLPVSFSLLLGILFLLFGTILQRLLFLGGTDFDFNEQLAGVSVLSGAAFELGRIASGEKPITRQEFDRDIQLKTEFQQFANARLILNNSITNTNSNQSIKRGGSCHKSDVIASFRRYYPQYRTEDINVLSNIELEQIIQTWNRQQPGYEEMTNAGFFKNFQVNTEADLALSSNNPF